MQQVWKTCWNQGWPKTYVAKSHTVRNKKKNSAQEEKQSGRRNYELNAGIVKADEIEEVEPYSDSTCNYTFLLVTFVKSVLYVSEFLMNIS